MRRFVILIAALIAAPLIYFFYMYFLSPTGIDVSSSAICVTNESNQTLVVTADANSGAEITGLLSPGEELCAPSPVAGDTGAVRVFESEDAIEGCSRLAKAGKTERLLAYSSFDNCKWANE
ncbi:MAG: hypothetical protein AB8B94_04460 [Hyphomicrobiales bacterium]